MQNQKPLATTAYTPVLAKLPKPHDKGESEEEEHERSENEKSRESEEENGTSSESESSDGEGPGVGKKFNEHQVTPSLGDELNHAKCIQDLSFFKVNWETGTNEFDNSLMTNLKNMTRDELEMHLERLTQNYLDTFHRPSIHKTFQELDIKHKWWQAQRDKSKGRNFNLIEEQAPKMDVHVRKEAKDDAITKKLMSHEAFKDRFKLSNRKGKFQVFEHID